jgi:flavin reductase (DIM6/NTAB) family NADH-FMN oxidoreductase RutF/DNA-binding IclR family transcriptional regulator
VSQTSHDPQRFREVLGQYPTGVSIVTGIGESGQPVGLAVGTFSSVSLDPPLVAFMPGRTSTSWPKIEPAGHFCINVLGEAQEDICRVFASKSPDKFAALGWRPADSGAPIINGVVAWVDCDLEMVHEAGDHFIVLGRVRALDLETPALPLVFFQGGYGRFAPKSMASADASLAHELRLADLARPAMERVTEQLGGRCNAATVSGDEVVVVASAGQLRSATSRLIGARTPVSPVLGTLFMAYADASAVDRWLAQADTEAQRADYRGRLDGVRARGYSVALRSPLHADFERMWKDGEITSGGALSDEARTVIRDLPYDPPDFSPERCDELRSLHVPVFGSEGHVPLALNYYPDSRVQRSPEKVQRYIDVLLDAADQVTAASGGRRP